MWRARVKAAHFQVMQTEQHKADINFICHIFIIYTPWDYGWYIYNKQNCAANTERTTVENTYPTPFFFENDEQGSTARQ